MTYTLLIVESPAKCKKIESFLGVGYKCIASYGHFREFKDGLKSIDFENNFKPTYKISPSKMKYVRLLKIAAKKANEIILAADDDREGEAIAWHVAKVLDLPIKTTKRIIFHEITKTAVLRAVNNPTIINMDKVQAQHARQILDLLVGFTISPILWKNIPRKRGKKGLSAGRCQTPALRLIYDNQIEIDKSSGEKVYTTIGIFTKYKLDFKLSYDYKKDEEIEDFMEESVNHDHKFTCKKPRKTTKKQPQPFTTSTLQQKASNEFHYSPKETMKLAQKLYEKGYITYMRTDSKAYSKEFIDKTKNYITEKYSKEHILSSIDDNIVENKQKKKKKGDNAQEAHEAIRPTKIERNSIQSDVAREIKLYYLIWRNTLESCMSPAEYLSISANISSPKKPYYVYKTELIQFPGWKAVAGFEKENPIYDYLLGIKQGTILEYSKITSKATLKKMIMHYTEAKLVQLLERRGIGRPSTFSSLIDKIQDRGYVKKDDVAGKTISCKDYTLIDDTIEEEEAKRTFGNEKNKLVLQPIGKIVIEFLIKNFNHLFIYEYTKKMEDWLDNISKGEKMWYELCKECYNQINSASTDIKAANLNEIKIDETYTYFVGQYGPCLKYKEGGKTKYKSAKKDLDLEKLKNGKYTMEEIIKPGNTKFGEHLGKEIILKEGQFGKYVTWNGKNISLKSLGNNITLETVIPLLTLKNPNMVRELKKDLSIRKGKWGPYIFYKNPKKKKPSFLKLNGCSLNIHTCPRNELIDWIKEKYNI